jgi:hypothetical protein
MLCLVLVSFAVCAALGYFTLAPLIAGEPAPEAAVAPVMPAEVVQKTSTGGRVWLIPSTIAGLRGRKGWHHSYSRLSADEGETQLTYHKLVTEEYTNGVILRYIEYCITAPLLFLAVVCLMVPDPPAWLFITGYWLVLICNAIGVALHASFMGDLIQDRHVGEPGMLVWGVIKTFFSYPW